MTRPDARDRIRRRSADGPATAPPAPGADHAPAARAASNPSVDPRAIRVAVSSAGRLEGDTTIVISPPGGSSFRPIDDAHRTAIPDGSPIPVDQSGDGSGSTHRPSSPEAGSFPHAFDLAGVEERVGLEWFDRDHALLLEHTAEGDLGTRIVFGPVHRRETDGKDVREVVVEGWRVEVELEPERRASLRERARRASDATGHGGPVDVHAIIPGRIVALSVATGDAVEAGQQLLVLEAMKMQNELRAPRGGAVERILIAVGDNVEVGDLLMVIT